MLVALRYSTVPLTECLFPPLRVATRAYEKFIRPVRALWEVRKMEIDYCGERITYDPMDWENFRTTAEKKYCVVLKPRKLGGKDVTTLTAVYNLFDTVSDAEAWLKDLLREPKEYAADENELWMIVGIVKADHPDQKVPDLLAAHPEFRKFKQPGRLITMLPVVKIADNGTRRITDYASMVDLEDKIIEKWLIPFYRTEKLRYPPAFIVKAGRFEKGDGNDE